MATSNAMELRNTSNQNMAMGMKFKSRLTHAVKNRSANILQKWSFRTKIVLKKNNYQASLLILKLNLPHKLKYRPKAVEITFIIKFHRPKKYKLSKLSNTCCWWIKLSWLSSLCKVALEAVRSLKVSKPSSGSKSRPPSVSAKCLKFCKMKRQNWK